MNTDGQEKPRKRKWLKRLVVLLVLLAVLVAASPYIVSTRTVLNGVLGLVNDMLHGSIGVDGLSLGWGGPTRVAGVTITDPAGRQVLRVENVTASGGTWSMIASALAFGQIEIDRADVVLYVTPEGGLSLIDAVTPIEPSQPDPDEPLPEPAGKVLLKNATVRVVQLDGREMTVTDVSAEVTLESLNRIVATAAATLATGGTLKLDAELTGLIRDGQLDPAKVDGTVKLRTDPRIGLGGLCRFAAPDIPAEAQLGITADVKLTGGDVQASWSLDAKQCSAPRTPADTVQPIDIRLAGLAALTGRKLSGQTILAVGADSITEKFEFGIPSEPIDISAEKLVAAVLRGEKLALPNFSLAAGGKLDLARLAAAMPAVLGVREKVTISSASVTVTDVSLQGGERPGGKGRIALSNFVAVREGKPIRWQPIALAFDASIVPGTGLTVRDTGVTSDFATLTAAGTPAKLEAQFQADLAKLRAQLGEVFDMGELGLSGTAAGAMNLTRADQPAGKPQRVDFQLTSTVQALTFARGERKLVVNTMSLGGRGHLAHAADGNAQVELASGEVKADNDLSLVAAGRYDLSGGGLDVGVEIRRAVLPGLAAKAKAFGAEGLDQITAGELAGSATAKRDGADGPLTSAGMLVIKGLAVDKKPVGPKDITLAWTDLKVAADGNSLALAQAKLDSGPAVAEATGLDVSFGGKLRATGTASVTASLAKCLELWARLSGQEKPPQIAGQLTWSGKAETTAGVVAVNGSGKVDGLEIKADDKTIRPKQVSFAQAVRIDPGKKALMLDSFRLDSDILAVTAAGTVGDYTGAAVLDVKGHYKGDWERLMALAHQLSPDTKDITLTGPLESDFALTGPASRPQLEPTFRELAANAGVGWTSAKVVGIELGEAKLTPRLAEGRLNVPLTEIDASGGKMRVGATVDLGGEKPLLLLPGETAVLENVEVTPEVGRLLLSRFNPIFGQVVGLEGRLNLSTREIRLPLGPEIKKAGSGSGKLDLSGMKIRPDGLMKELLSLGGIPEEKTHVLDVGSVDFLIADGGIKYDNFALTFDKTFELIFRGTVRFDDELDLFVGVPVRSALLRRFGVRGPVDQYARLLEGARVDIPVVGTRENPKLDLSKVDLRPLIDKAVKGLLKDKGGGLLEGVLKGLGGDANSGGPTQLPKPDGQPDGAKPPATRPAPKKPEDEAADAVKGVLDSLLK